MSKTRLQKYYKNLITIIIALRTSIDDIRIYLPSKKKSNFSFGTPFHLLYTSTNSTYDNRCDSSVPCNNSQYWMEQIQTRSQCERVTMPPSSTPLHSCTHIPAVSRRSSFCRGIIGLYEPDKNTRQRQKSHTSQGLYMHSPTCTCVSLHICAPFSFCFPSPWLLWSCQCPAVSMGEFCRRLMEINGSLWWKVRERERQARMSRRSRYGSRIGDSFRSLKLLSVIIIVSKIASRLCAEIKGIDSNRAIEYIVVVEDKSCLTRSNLIIVFIRLFR